MGVLNKRERILKTASKSVQTFKNSQTRVQTGIVNTVCTSKNPTKSRFETIFCLLDDRDFGLKM
jgi:hypothetical protein